MHVFWCLGLVISQDMESFGMWYLVVVVVVVVAAAAAEYLYGAIKTSHCAPG